MDAAVLDELRERQLRHLASDAVERGEDDRLRRVVDDEVDARQVLQRADVAALAADDTALHVVGRELDHRDRRLRRMAGGDALEGVGDERCARAASPPRAPPPPRSAPCARARGARAPRSARASDASRRQPSGRRRARAPSAALPSQPSVSSWSCFTCVSRSLSACSFRSMLRELSIDFLLLRGDPLLRLHRPRRAGRSPRAPLSRASWSASSRASTCASRRMASARALGAVRHSLDLLLGGRAAAGRAMTREPAMAPTTRPTATPIRMPITTSIARSYVPARRNGVSQSVRASTDAPRSAPTVWRSSSSVCSWSCVSCSLSQVRGVVFGSDLENAVPFAGGLCDESWPHPSPPHPSQSRAAPRTSSMVSGAKPRRARRRAARRGSASRARDAPGRARLRLEAPATA